ncbi:hypothetical protein [Tropicibacter oceani]|uniref:Uncharacterized protein n=1 Tax=Tropicibacter oceani TaxID=3058420 RepID=A0ABY8QKA7_9RHOB|nr:hypothetical protein [Tropicibacter oceani]WGW05066.1 hypothetical protein QF118_05825 [Tropicibacter oceani]
MRFLPLLPLLLAPLGAAASGPGESHAAGPAYLEGGVFTYDLFETAVSHVDLATCPAEFDPEAVFCRMSLVNDMAHVFVFSFEGDQPLLAVKSYDLDDDFLPF